MYSFLTKNGQMIAFAIGTLISLAFVAMVSGSDADMSVVSDGSMNEPGLGLGLNASIGLAIICALAMVVFGLYQVATDIKGSKKGIIGVAVLALIFIIGYNAANTDLSDSMAALLDKFDVTDGQYKFISGSILTTLILVIIAAVAFIFSELSNFFK